MIPDDNLDEVRSKLEVAAVFARNFDPSGAVARAKEALRIATDPDARDEALLMLREFETEAREWRIAAGAEGRAYEAEELAAAEVDDPRAEREKAPAPRQSPWRYILDALRPRRSRTEAPAH
jgi:hypothetical protein